MSMCVLLQNRHASSAIYVKIIHALLPLLLFSSLRQNQVLLEFVIAHGILGKVLLILGVLIHNRTLDQSITGKKACTTVV